MKNKVKIIIALVCALALAATGTFAWETVISARNEFMGSKDDVTLHDDFDPGIGKKDVYVENTGNVTLFVRVKLAEAMNIGNNKWRPSGAGDWKTHTHGETARDCGKENAQGHLYHSYFTWTMGGQKWYMPKSSGGSVMHDIREHTSETPGAKQTPNAAVITSDEYLNMSSEQQKAFIGWIYSTDGCAYWSQPLKEGEATGLLLHGVATSGTLSNEAYYYAIDVIVEVVDRTDVPMWTEGAEPSQGGDKHPEDSQDGKDVITIIAGGDNGGGEGNGGDGGGDNGEPGGGDNGEPGGGDNGEPGGGDGGEPGDGDGGEPGGGDNGEPGGGDSGEPGGGTDTGSQLPVNPGPFRPIYTGDPDAGDGFYAKHDFKDPTNPQNNVVFHNGSIHLEDIITDGDYTGVTVTAAAPAKYAGFVTIGSDHHGKPSIIYSYFPTSDEWNDRLLEHGDSDIAIPVQVTLSRGGKSATVTIIMIYPDCVIGYDI